MREQNQLMWMRRLDKIKEMIGKDTSQERQNEQN